MPSVHTPPSIWLKLVFVALFWGGTWVAGRVAVAEASPLAVASWRFLIAAATLGTLLVVRRGWPRWTRAEWAVVTWLGVSGIFLYNLCFLYGLKYIQAGRGALVVALTPAVVAAADWLLFGAAMTPLKAAGILVAMAGCLVVVTQGDPSALFTGGVGLGEWLIIGCVLLWAAYTFIGRRATVTLRPLDATFGAALTGWAMLSVAALIDGTLFSLGGLTLSGLSGIVFLGFFGTAIAFTWYADAVRIVGATSAAAFINLVPVSAVVFGALLLGEHTDIAVLAGGALVIAGVFITNQAGRRQAAQATRDALATQEKTA